MNEEKKPSLESIQLFFLSADVNENTIIICFDDRRNWKHKWCNFLII